MPSWFNSNARDVLAPSLLPTRNREMVKVYTLMEHDGPFIHFKVYNLHSNLREKTRYQFPLYIYIYIYCVATLFYKNSMNISHIQKSDFKCRTSCIATWDANKRRVTSKNDVLLRINDWFFFDDRIISVIMICTDIDWLNVWMRWQHILIH